MGIGTVVDESDLVDEILGRYRTDLGRSYTGYRNHAFRMLNFGRYLVPDEPGRDDRLAIMGAFHDLPFFISGDLDYLGRACDWTREYLAASDRLGWEPEIRLMIENHHKVRTYRGPHPAYVNAARQADWIDVSFTRIRFGIPRSFIREVAVRFPIHEAYVGVALPMIGRYAAKHLSRPLPMVRW